VRVALAELSDERDVDRLIKEISGLPEISALINNAGFGFAGYFTDNADLHMRMLAVHVTAPVRLTAAVLPAMKRRGSGLIINVSSLASFFPMPKGATYAATKQYLNVFSESLQMELKPYGISIQALCPGMTRTDFHSRDDYGRKTAQRYPLGWMRPETVVRRSLKHVGGRPVVYIPGLMNKVIGRILSHVPKRIYYSVIQRYRT
jgi:short-subunit dehydrogenase